MKTQEQKYLKEFLESKCDLFSSDDWNFYVEMTGKKLSWLRENANFYSNNGIYGTCLENAIIDNDFEAGAMFI